MRLLTAVACAWALLAGPAAAQQPLGIVDMQFARLDPDTLRSGGAGDRVRGDAHAARAEP